MKKGLEFVYFWDTCVGWMLLSFGIQMMWFYKYDIMLHSPMIRDTLRKYGVTKKMARPIKVMFSPLNIFKRLNSLFCSDAPFLTDSWFSLQEIRWSPFISAPLWLYYSTIQVILFFFFFFKVGCFTQSFHNHLEVWTMISFHLTSRLGNKK